MPSHLILWEETFMVGHVSLYFPLTPEIGYAIMGVDLGEFVRLVAGIK